MILFSKQFNNTDYLKHLFKSYNCMFFDNSLPEIPVIIIDSNTLNGSFKFDYDDKYRILKNPRIEISFSNQYTYNELETTMIHEMAHYKVFLNLTSETISKAFDAYDNNDIETFKILLAMDKYGHSDSWKSIINELNHKYNIKIDIRKY